MLPFSAGGSADTAMRMFGEVIKGQTGLDMIIVNKPGGGGAIAAATVKSARPDGSTIRLADIGTDAILPALQHVAYDPSKDFEPIAQLMSWDQFIAVPAASPAHSVKELIAYAKSKPGGLNFGSQGVGSGGHILGAMFQGATGIPFTHIPYKGGHPLAADLLADRVDFAFVSYREMQGPLAANKVRILAAATTDRSKLLPDVPTLGELGIKNVVLAPWFGLTAPAGTPKARVEAIHDAFANAAKDAKLQEKLRKLAIDVNVTSPEAFSAYIKSEGAKYAKVIKEHHIMQSKK